MEWPRAVLLVLLVATFLTFCLATSCPHEKLAVYQLEVQTFWTRERFPKHYPDWRPPAQWSKTVGRSHGSNYSLFQLGEHASPGLKLFAETGRTEQLDSAGLDGVLDVFQAPPISTGEGHVEALFFVDGNHSQVSLITRIIPSPDWFIGVDSFELCVNANWIDSVTIELDPIDAGTDNGFTFTAPNWPTDPQGVVYRVTHTYPPHPASSFYYPSMKRLPAIATFRFVKLREYELTADHFEQQNEGKVIKMEHVTKYINTNQVNNDEEISTRTTTTTTSTTAAPTTTTTTTTRTLPTTMASFNLSGDPVAAELPAVMMPRGDTSAIMNSIMDTYRNKKPAHHRKIRRRMREQRLPRDCRVSEWNEWSECSKSCGIGEMQRRRVVLKPSRRGGKPCPPLLETKWCGSARSCPSPYFKW